MDKSVFAPREPVFLSLTLSNDGDEIEEVQTSDPYSFCSDYQIQISRAGAPKIECFQGFGGSCLTGAVQIAPHSVRTERILLNYPNRSRGDLNPPVSLPGDYTVDAVRVIRYAPLSPDAQLFENPAQSEVHQTFYLSVDRTLQAGPSVYAHFVQLLASKDDQKRAEAARTLATVAPLALEPVLLTFATSKDPLLKQFAPLALANLSTEESLSALAKMLSSAEPGTYEFVTAAESLGKTHDPKWFPMLLEMADRHGAMYLSYAAESGGEAAIPALVQRLNTSNSSDRSNAIYALGATGSRSVIPLLIGLLRTSIDPEGVNVAAAANAALQQLAHHYIESREGDTWIDGARQRWQRWWLTSGQTAEVYRPGECVPDTPLP